MTSRYIQATQKLNPGPPPVWMMRQAGRYMQQYRDIRAKYDFLDMVKTPALAAEITLQPIHAFGMDAAILFSDILVTAESLGSHVDFIEKKGPVIAKPIRSLPDVSELSTADTVEKLHYVFKAIQEVKPSLNALNTPLIGFAGAPFTVASYMIEGASSSDLKTVKQLMFNTSEVVHALLDKLTLVTIDYLKGQINAGVDALQIFDTWALHLSWDDFQIFSLAYTQKIISEIKAFSPETPVTLFCKGSSGFAPLIAATQADVMSLDWPASLLEMRKAYPQLALQGNLDPYVLYAAPDILEKKVKKILADMHQDPGFIFNLGHGLMPDMNPDQVKRVVELVQQA